MNGVFKWLDLYTRWRLASESPMRQGMINLGCREIRGRAALLGAAREMIFAKVLGRGLQALIVGLVALTAIEVAQAAVPSDLSHTQTGREPEWARGISSNLLKEEKRFNTPSAPQQMWWSPDGKWLASLGFQDVHVRIWDVASGREVSAIRVLYEMYDNRHGRVAWSPNGKWLAIAQGWGGVKVVSVADWQAVTPGVYEELRGNDALAEQQGIPVSVHFTPDSKRLIVYLNFKSECLGHTAVWDMASWRQKNLANLQPENGGNCRRVDEGRSSIQKVAYTSIRPDILAVYMERYALSDHYKALPSKERVDGRAEIVDPWLELRDVATGETRARFTAYVDRREHEVLWGSIVQDMVFDSTGSHLALADRAGNRISIWDVQNGKRTHLLMDNYDNETRPAPITRNLAYSPDGRYLFSNDVQQDGHVLIWALPDYRLANLVRDIPFPTAIVFSPNGKQVALSSDRSIRIYTFQH